MSSRIPQKPHVLSLPDFVQVDCASAPSFSDDVAIRYVLPVLWVTSYFHVMAHTARGAGNIESDVGSVEQYVRA